MTTDIPSRVAVREAEVILLELVQAVADRGTAAERAVAAQVLCRGVWWSPAPLPKGVRLRKAGRCFANAQVVAMRDGCPYVEGYALSLGRDAVHHGWCGSGGTAVDPTCRTPATAYLGVAFSPAEVANWVLERRFMGSMLTPDNNPPSRS